MKVPVVLPPELQSMLQGTPAPAPSPAAPSVTDPGQVIGAAGQAITDANARYKDLRALIQQINGLPESAPLPESLQIESIVINYSVNGLSKSAAVHRVQRVGDLFNLLNRDVDELINTLRAQALVARDAATVVEEACSRAQYAANARQSPVAP